MRIRSLHSFHLTPREAVALQTRLAVRISLRPCSGPIRRIVGTDVSYEPTTRKFYAAAVLLAWPGLEVLEIGRARGDVQFPYVPGLLSFREIPPLLAALRKLRATPDLLVCDGQGLAHPRRFGLACHLGLLLDLPSFGCAKSRLVGEHARLPRSRGSRVRLTHRNRAVGWALRTREGAREVYVSPGHRISHLQAAQWALRLTRRHRIPEPTRLADREVARMRREIAHGGTPAEPRA